MTEPPPAARGPRLAMSGVTQRFGATIALDGVDFAVQPGEVHALIGENGAGKSTLMKVLAGALQPDAGRMELDGARYAPRSPADALAAGVAMIHQELALAPHLSVMENVLLGALPCRGPFVDWGGARALARAALESVGRGDLDLDTRVAALALADRQQVEIARAVRARARAIVFDEPTSSLGAAETERLFALIRRLQSEGTAIVYISHALEEVFAIAERYTVLRDGRTVASGALSGASVDAIVAAMIGRKTGELFARSPARPGEVVARIEHLAGERLPLDATLEIRRGEVLGIAGLVGAGRTELLRALFGLDRVVRGELHVLGAAGARPPGIRWRQGAGLVSEDRQREGLAVALSVADNLVLPRLDRLGRAWTVSSRAVESAARTWIERARIRCASPHQAVRELSGGNQQKLALARLLLADADLLLLDEPTRGIDVGSKAEIYRTIDALARGAGEERPRAVVVISSYLPELLGLCDRIAVMHRGRLGPARARAELDEHAIMLAATGGAPGSAPGSAQ